MDFFDENFLTVRFYKRPNGVMEEIEMRNIYEKDIEYFKSNDIVVSLEDIGNDIVVYACPRDDLDEESEVMELSRGRSCQETMKSLREKCEEAF